MYAVIITLKVSTVGFFRNSSLSFLKLWDFYHKGVNLGECQSATSAESALTMPMPEKRGNRKSENPAKPVDCITMSAPRPE